MCVDVLSGILELSISAVKKVVLVTYGVFFCLVFFF